jgi:hypothetical protein
LSSGIFGIIEGSNLAMITAD